MRRSTQFVAVCLTSWAGLALSGADSPNLDGMPTQEEFMAATGGYPYEAPAKRAERIRGGVPELRLCMGQARVLELLGAPDFSEPIHGPKGRDDGPNGSIWTYHLSKRNAAVSAGDASVVVFFNAIKLLRFALVPAILGASDINGLEGGCS